MHLRVGDYLYLCCMCRYWGIGLFLMLVGCQSTSDNAQTAATADTLQVEKNVSMEQWRQLADSLTIERQKVILQNLLQVSEKEGWGGAVRYCHAAADTLTFYQSAQVSFQRVALGNRNPKNALADSLDRAAYERFAKSGEKESFITEAGNGTLRVYRPIYIPMAQCLKCHGKPEDLDGQALAEIRKRYPNDKATGFAVGDLRGMWKVEIRP